jgi:hypothetical protein
MLYTRRVNAIRYRMKLASWVGVVTRLRAERSRDRDSNPSEININLCPQQPSDRICVLCTGGVNSLRSRPALSAVQAGTAESSRLQKQRSTQSRAHSRSTIKCNLNVTITNKVLPEDDPAVSKHKSVLRLMIKLSLCVCWWLVFLYNTVHGHGTQ